MLPDNPTCTRYNGHARQLLLEGRYDGVVLGADWSTAIDDGYRLEELAETVAWLLEQDLKVIVIGQSPTFARRVPALYAWGNMGPGRNSAEGQPIQGPELNRRLEANSKGAIFADPWPLFCTGQTCRFGEGERLYFWDYGHYTLLGSQLAASQLLLPALAAAESQDR